MKAALAVPCPVCGAGKGQSCVRPLLRNADSDRLHRERWREYQRSLPRRPPRIAAKGAPMIVEVCKLQAGDKVGPGEGHPSWYTVHRVVWSPALVEVQVQYADGGYGTRTFDSPSVEVYVERHVQETVPDIPDGGKAS